MHWRGPSLTAAGAPLWRGHLFLFDRAPARPSYSERVGRRLLVIAVAVESARWFVNLLDGALAPLWVRAPLYLAVALVAARWWSGLTWPQIGLRRWTDWNRIEKAYFIQVLLIANIVFPAVFARRLEAIVSGPDAMAWLGTTFVPYLFSGFYQEVVYRGFVQTELTRRWGALAGITVSNIFYTFGPLHSTYFFSNVSLAVPMFAAIFAIGLLFAGVFRQSGNLWIVAVMHAIGNAYIVGSLVPTT